MARLKLPMRVRHTLGDHIQHIVINILGVFLLIVAAWSVIQQNWEAAVLCIVAFLSQYIPPLIERHSRTTLPIEFHAGIFLFVFASLFLGTVSGAYWHLWWWDDLLHGLSGLVVGFAVFLVLYTLYTQNRLRISFSMIAVFTFCVSMAAGALWEMWEFMLDSFFGQNAQRGNADTMGDLVIDALGALFAAIAGYLYLKTEGRSRRNPLRRLIANFKHHNPHLFSDK